MNSAAHSIDAGTHARLRDAAYKHALGVANGSDHVAGLDAWWSLLKREERAEMSRLVSEHIQALSAGTGEERDGADRDETGEEWAAYTYRIAGLESDRWSRAHLILTDSIGFEHVACGRGPKREADARWAHEIDADSGRCSHCERIARLAE